MCRIEHLNRTRVLLDGSSCRDERIDVRFYTTK